MRLICVIIMILSIRCNAQVDTVKAYKATPKTSFEFIEPFTKHETFLTVSEYSRGKLQEVLKLKNDTGLIVTDSLAAIKGLIRAVKQNGDRLTEAYNENKRLREMVKQLIRDEPKYAVKRQQ